MSENLNNSIFCVFFGCCSNLYFLEKLIIIDPGSGNLITFLQFLFIALEGLIFTMKFFTRQRKIPLKDYIILVIMFFITSLCNNYVFDLNIPIPLHIIFRSGSLITNLIMGIFILKKNYNIIKYISVIMITIGIFICTLMSGLQIEEKHHHHHHHHIESQYSIHFWWIIGIGLLTLALLITSRMGLYQEVLYKRYGKYPKEALFYAHFLPLPFFGLIYNNIIQHFIICSNSIKILIPIINYSIPIAWLYLFGNILTQYICIRSVYILTSECSSLTVTLIVTLRKFISLIISIIYFKNLFTFYHGIGTTFVFFGTILFTE
ncbi:UDP-xylose and UDP-N-acetylglucosamine transporter-like, partial [Condylostylus longicornis]|uniref:UDP-xylose and UDP-N-acetylglucosamine transporter-like n=1 Tax=Condylostylus longicornis TaxID=2530218 RepID=UPI00244DD44C